MTNTSTDHTDAGLGGSFATGQFIDGRWSEGSSSHILVDRDPYTGAVIAEIPAASVEDIDRAYRAAEAASRAGLDSVHTSIARSCTGPRRSCVSDPRRSST